MARDTGRIPNKGMVYESFKRYVDDKRHPDALEKESIEAISLGIPRFYYVAGVVLTSGTRPRPPSML